MKLKQVNWQWIIEHRVSIKHIRGPVDWADRWYVDGRFHKRAKRIYKKWPVVTGFGDTS